MIFQEYKTQNEKGEWHYLCEDVFGIIDLYSTEKLDKKILDLSAVNILKISRPQGNLEITHEEKKYGIRYTYKGANKWGEDSEVGSTLS